MKIGFLVDQISFGGGERIQNFLIDGLSSMENEIYIFTWNKLWDANNVASEYKIVTMNSSPVGVLGKIKNIFILRRQLLKNKPDCLIILSSGLAEIGVFSARLAKGCSVILSERVDPAYLPKEKIHRVIKRILYTICDGVVFQTEKVKSYFNRITQNKSIVIKNPVIDEVIQSSIITNPQKEIVSVGRLSKEKNFEMLIRAFGQIRDYGYVLRIFGDGPLKSDLLKLITDLSLNEIVFLEGNKKRITEEICRSDIFVLPSTHEGMPNALIEAMSVGLACISTNFNSGGAEALIRNNENGLLVPINNEKRLVEALIFLIENEEIKLRIKRNALKINTTNEKSIILNQWINFIQSKCEK